MNVEDILKGFGRIIDAIEDLKMAEMIDSPDLPYEIDCLKNDVEALRDSVEEALKEATNED